MSKTFTKLGNIFNVDGTGMLDAISLNWLSVSAFENWYVNDKGIQDIPDGIVITVVASETATPILYCRAHGAWKAIGNTAEEISVGINNAPLTKTTLSDNSEGFNIPAANQVTLGVVKGTAAIEDAALKYKLPSYIANGIVYSGLDCIETLEDGFYIVDKNMDVAMSVDGAGALINNQNTDLEADVKLIKAVLKTFLDNNQTITTV